VSGPGDAGAVWAHLDSAGAEWLRAAVADVRARPEAVRTSFPAAGRHCGRSALVAGDPDGLVHGTVDDAARGLLLAALPLTGAALTAEVVGLYRFGDAAERRGVLRGLPAVDVAVDVAVDATGGVGADLVELVLDGLRTNDRRLVAAALGPCARRLADHDWRHGVLKCLFTGVPLAAVADLDERADPELGAMFLSFAHERVAAGRDVPADTWLVVDRFPELLAASALPAELHSPVPARRGAAERALSGRAPSRNGRGG
jgi:hypothetical protein